MPKNESKLPDPNDVPNFYKWLFGLQKSLADETYCPGSSDLECLHRFLGKTSSLPFVFSRLVALGYKTPGIRELLRIYLNEDNAIKEDHAIKSEHMLYCGLMDAAPRHRRTGSPKTPSDCSITGGKLTRAKAVITWTGQHWECFEKLEVLIKMAETMGGVMCPVTRQPITAVLLLRSLPGKIYEKIKACDFHPHQYYKVAANYEKLMRCLEELRNDPIPDNCLSRMLESDTGKWLTTDDIGGVHCTAKQMKKKQKTKAAEAMNDDCADKSQLISYLWGLKRQLEELRERGWCTESLKQEAIRQLAIKLEITAEEEQMTLTRELGDFLIPLHNTPSEAVRRLKQLQFLHRNETIPPLRTLLDEETGIEGMNLFKRLIKISPEFMDLAADIFDECYRNASLPMSLRILYLEVLNRDGYNESLVIEMLEKYQKLHKGFLNQFLTKLACYNDDQKIYLPFYLLLFRGKDPLQKLEKLFELIPALKNHITSETLLRGVQIRKGKTNKSAKNTDFENYNFFHALSETNGGCAILLMLFNSNPSMLLDIKYEQLNRPCDGTNQLFSSPTDVDEPGTPRELQPTSTSIIENLEMQDTGRELLSLFPWGATKTLREPSPPLVRKNQKRPLEEMIEGETSAGPSGSYVMNETDAAMNNDSDSDSDHDMSDYNRDFKTEHGKKNNRL